MDERYELKGVTFIWDSSKAQSYLAKHSIAFSLAAQAFFAPFLRITHAGTSEEARDAVIGMDERWNLLFVVHIVLEEAAIRIISARKATQSERNFYES